MSRPGDWNCRACLHHNFQRRESCQRCGELKSGAGIGRSMGSNSSSAFVGFTTGSDVRPGDWYCAAAACGAHNFASRSSCFKCGAFKDDLAAAGAGFDCADLSRSARGFSLAGGVALSPGAAARPGWKSGDWICTRSGCNEHNFASRIECFRCNAPRDSY